MRKVTRLFLLVCVIVLAGATASAQQGLGGLMPQGGGGPAQAERFSVSADISSKQVTRGSSLTMTASIDCAPEHYIYQDTLSIVLKSVEPAESAFGVGELDLPEPKTKYDKFMEEEVQYQDGTFSMSAPVTVAADAQPGSYTLTFEVGYRGCGPDRCYLPATKRVSFDVEVTEERAAGAPTTNGKEAAEKPPAEEKQPEGAPEAAAEEEGQLAEEQMGLSAPEDGQQGQAAMESEFGDMSLILGMLLAFLGGLGLFLTPCVYPMIPITVGIVGATSEESRLDGLKKSLVYVLGISVTYALFGVIAATLGEPFGSLTQHPALYITLAVVFLVMAGAMFDLYVIQVPSSWASQWQAKLRGKGGIAGIFLIGLLSGIVATPCIAPVIYGLAAYVFQSGNQLKGFLLFFSLAWGMGTPLVVLGTFTGLVKSLPKSGGWLQTVKHFFGLALIGAAAYFVDKSGVVPEFWFNVGLAAVTVIASVFVGAFDRLELDSGWKARARKAIGLLLLGAGVTVFAGAVLPERMGAGPAKEVASIEWLTSEDKAVQLAKEQDKPMMIDFRADYCPPCIKMEKTTFKDPDAVEESKRFVPLKIDVGRLEDEKVDEYRDRYGLFGVPYIVFVGSDGRIKADLSVKSYVNADELLKRMQQVE